MREVFADTSYWVALLLKRDDLHEVAKAVSLEVQNALIVTTDGVIVEVFNFFCERGPEMRKAVMGFYDVLKKDPNVIVLPQRHDLLQSAIERFGQRCDKGYSLTDCYTMIKMQKRGIDEILTYDHHFEQEGFTALMRNRGQ